MIHWLTCLLLLAVHSVVLAQSKLEPCQGKNIKAWDVCVGEAVWPDARKYLGEWKNGQPHGQGTLTDSKGAQFLGEFDEGRFSGLQRVWGFKNGLPSGYGQYTFSDGTRYTGEWRNGLFHGLGTLKLKDGAEYRGQWKAGKPDGRGVFISRDTEYRGDFSNGQRDGQGFLKKENYTYQGTWKNNKPHGWGAETNFNEIYAGEWKDGLYDGHGAKHFGGLTRYSGNWRYGVQDPTTETFVKWDIVKDGRSRLNQTGNPRPVPAEITNYINGMSNDQTSEFMTDLVVTKSDLSEEILVIRHAEAGYCGSAGCSGYMIRRIGDKKQLLWSGHSMIEHIDGNAYLFHHHGSVCGLSGASNCRSIVHLVQDGLILVRQGDLRDGVLITSIAPLSASDRIDPKILAERAKQGNAEAQFQYGMSFLTGPESSNKPRIAIEWLTKAAAQGHESAKRQIANMFDLGVQMSQMDSSIQVR